MESRAVERCHGCKKLFDDTFIRLLRSQNRSYLISCEHVIESHSHCQLFHLKRMITKSLQITHAHHHSSNLRPLSGRGLIVPGGCTTLPEWWILACFTSSYKSSNQLKLPRTIWENALWRQFMLNAWTISAFSRFKNLLSQVHPVKSPNVWLTRITQITESLYLSNKLCLTWFLSNILAAWLKIFSGLLWGKLICFPCIRWNNTTQFQTRYNPTDIFY